MNLQLLLERQTRGRGAAFLRRTEPGLAAGRLEHRLGLAVVDAFADQDVGDLVGDARDVAVHEFASCVPENKPIGLLPRSGRGIHTSDAGRSPVRLSSLRIAENSFGDEMT